jgi:hypothetical protein
MALGQPLNISGKTAAPTKVNINDFKGGYNSFLDAVRKPNNALDAAENIILDQDGVPKRRPGTKNFGEPLMGVIDGDGTFAKYDSDARRLVEYNIAVADGVVYTAKDAKNWTAATGATLTPGHDVNFLAIDDKVFILNAHDSLAYYDTTDNDVKMFVPIDTPAAPTLTRSADLSEGNITLRYAITAINATGETMGGPVATINVNKQRDTWQNTTGDGAKSENVTLEWANVAGAIRYNIYFTDGQDEPCYIDSIGASDGDVTTYIDEARMAVNMALAIPLDDTTGGPRLGNMSYSDNRIFGTQDPDHPYRVYWGGVAGNLTAFSPFYGGGWVDIGRGGDLVPIFVKSYRDGKGEPINTVFMDDASKLGEQFQITLSTMTVGTTSFIVPIVARVIGSYGTPAADSVIEAQNNLFYLNKNAVSTTGAKPEMLNVLSTDEVSLAIRPNVRSINSAYIHKVCAVFFDGKILFGVPYNHHENNEVWVLDLELKTWVRPWKLAVKKFIVYTGEDGVQRLLYRPSDDASDQKFLVEIDESYATDNGVPFPVYLATSIINFDSSHFAFERVKKVYFELLRAVGQIDITISGAMKNREIQVLKDFHIATLQTYAGFDNELFDQSLFDKMMTIPKVYKPTYVKKVMRVGKTLNNIKVEINTNSAADWILSGISIVGIPKKVSDPSEWKR